MPKMTGLREHFSTRSNNAGQELVQCAVCAFPISSMRHTGSRAFSCSLILLLPLPLYSLLFLFLPLLLLPPIHSLLSPSLSPSPLLPSPLLYFSPSNVHTCLIILLPSIGEEFSFLLCPTLAPVPLTQCFKWTHVSSHSLGAPLCGAGVLQGPGHGL